MKVEDFSFAADSFTIEAASEDGPPKVFVKAYNGGKLKLHNFPYPVVIDTSKVTLHGGAQTQPLLRDHNQERPVGHGTPVIAGGQLSVDGTISVPGEESNQILAAEKNGFSWQASVGGQVPDRKKHVKVIAAGQKLAVNGREHEGPFILVSSFVWHETSFVALGADTERASARIAASLNKERTMKKDFRDWLEASGFDPDSLEDDQVQTLEAAFDATKTTKETTTEVQAGGDTLDVEAALRAQREEHLRLNRIEQINVAYADKVDNKETDSAALYASAVNGEITPDAYELQMLRASRQKGQTHNNAAKPAAAFEPTALEAALFRNSGVWDNDDDIAAALSSSGYGDDAVDKAMNLSASSKYRNCTLHDVILASCRQAGEDFIRVNDEAIQASMEWGYRHEQPIDVHASPGGFSTVSLPGILSRLANKAMLAAYAEADSGGVATRICSTTSTNDFKKFNRYRMTEAGVASLVAPGGEIKHTTLIEEEYENQVKTYGSLISLTRDMQINDDLNAFLQLPRMLGRQARHALEQIVIETLVNAPGTFFFDSVTGGQEPNYAEGADTALSLDSLGKAYELFLNQVDADGKPINIDPAILLTTNKNAVQARKLYNDTEYRFTTADRTETISNQWKGMFQPLKSSYLHRLGTTKSEDQWYLLSNPSTDVSGLQIAYLRGQRNPVLSRGEVAFNRLGSAWRVVFDFGVALQDRRSIVKMKGAA